ncbi:hypothetical protein [Solibacillus sp. FSL K6-1523]|uniref:hypothetical protein n=1 Tax=Solibacillus sp. FSL K6-1523 TaxID=2921471 RepID=UPI0030F74C27
MKKFMFLVILMCFLAGCTESKEDVKVIIDTTQFSNISSEKLISIMGEPEKVEDYEWTIPSTQKSIVGKLYIYEKNKYEFVLFDDAVARLNVYSGVYWGYDESTFQFKKGEDVIKAFGILETYKNMARTVNTGLVEKYSPVAKGIDEVGIFEIDNDTFGMARITYNSDFYN